MQEGVCRVVSVPAHLAALLPGWLSARRFAVPASMVRAATARRAAGDWRGACVAAQVDTRLDLAGIRDEFGVEVADRVGEDLRHLVPDLLRWHLPRRPGIDAGLLAPGALVTLAVYGAPVDGRAPALWVRTPAHLERPQRPTLGFGRLDLSRPDTQAERWDAARYLWDDRATTRLLHRLGGGDRTPFFHRDGRPLTAAELPARAPTPDDPVALTEWVTLLQDSDRIEEAWGAAGVDAQFASISRRSARADRPDRPSECSAMVPALVAAVRSACADRVRENGSAGLVLPPSAVTWFRSGSVTLHVTETGISATLSHERHGAPTALEAVPRAWWQRFSELELLRLGLIDRSGLHPLVRAAMFPGEALADDYQPGPQMPPVGVPVPVRCHGAWHRLDAPDGRLDAADHTPQEALREQTLQGLGGAVAGCFAALGAWRSGRGRLPRSLRELRRHALLLVAHGDSAGIQWLLAAGVDPSGIRDRRGRGLLHLLGQLPDGEDLVPRLVAAGLDINGRDSIARTPLCGVLFDGGSPALVRAMLDAGADPTLTDQYASTALHTLRSVEAASILPWLLAAGLELERYDEYGRTPLMSQVISNAPAEAIRAMLDAGADPCARDEYTDMPMLEYLDFYVRREDLDFLVDAVRAREAQP